MPYSTHASFSASAVVRPAIHPINLEAITSTPCRMHLESTMQMAEQQPGRDVHACGINGAHRRVRKKTDRVNLDVLTAKRVIGIVANQPDLAGTTKCPAQASPAARHPSAQAFAPVPKRKEPQRHIYTAQPQLFNLTTRHSEMNDRKIGETMVLILGYMLTTNATRDLLANFKHPHEVEINADHPDFTSRYSTLLSRGKPQKETVTSIHLLMPVCPKKRTSKHLRSHPWTSYTRLFFRSYPLRNPIPHLPHPCTLSLTF